MGFDETSRQYSFHIKIQPVEFWTKFNSRWLSQLSGTTNQHQDGNNSVSFTDFELKPNVVVAESHPHLSITSNVRDCTYKKVKFDQNEYNSVVSQRKMMLV